MTEAPVIVIKYGGSAMINAALKQAVVEDLVQLAAGGRRIALVHGGGPEIDLMLRTAGIAKKVVNGLRYTDAQTMEIVQMVLCGKLNKELCALIIRQGGSAIGLSGIDGALLRARRVTRDAHGQPVDLGLVGEITSVNTALLNALLRLQPDAQASADTGSAPYIPVISPAAFAEGEKDSISLNVNADTAAAKIAGALHASSLILMTDVPGIMRDVNNEQSIIHNTDLSELAALEHSGILSGGMIPKVDCCRLAITAGVGEVRIVDGRQPHALRKVIAENAKLGTAVMPQNQNVQ
ncbi:MAG: acetylglutamate kinase [Spirochaetaceae bacterium]|jgi:acetylglutamate kinase|nr:acetylglutamate kinase [Spirochaetaceae bacterium]